MLDNSDAEIASEMMYTVSLPILRIFLADPRSPNPMAIIDRILRAARRKRYGHGEDVARLVLSDPRVLTEKMSEHSVQLALDMLEGPLDGRISGARDAVSLGTGRVDVDPTEEALKGDIYSLVLRFILLKDPSTVELADWMISMDNEQLQEAARSVVAGEPIRRELAWARVLLLAMLYPTMTLDKLFQDKSLDRHSNAILTKTGVILGTYLGSSGIRNRRTR